MCHNYVYITMCRNYVNYVYMLIVHNISEYIIQHSKPSTILRLIHLFIIMKLFVAVLISLYLGWVGGTELCSIDESLLNDIIDNRITATLANQPSK